MYRLKIVFMICACSFVATQAITISDIFRHIYFKNIYQFFAPESTRNIEIQSVEHIDLTTIPYGDFKYYKGIMLLYCKVIDKRFLGGQQPIKWTSFIQLEKLDENYNQPESSDEDLHDEPILQTKSPAIRRLATLFFDLLVKYDTVIQPKGYKDMAFYYNLLMWLKSNVILSKKIMDKIKYITDIKTKARNYFHEFSPQEKIRISVDFSKNEYKTLEGWKDDKYSLALSFIIDMLVSNGDAAKTVPMDITDIAVYEEILFDADRDTFYHTMKIEKWDALAIVDNSFRVKHGEELGEKSLEHERPNFENINLLNLQLYSVQYYKNVAILFVEAMERKTKRVLLTKPFYIDLDTYSERNEATTLRYCAFQWWFSSVVRYMQLSLNLTKKMQRFEIRSYVFRLVGWMIHQINKNQIYKHQDEDKCEDLSESLVALLRNLKAAANVYAVLMRGETMMSIFNSQFDSANTIDLLSTLGEKHDKLTASILYIVKTQMETDLGSFKQILPQLKADDQQIANSDQHTSQHKEQPPATQGDEQTPQNHETPTNDENPVLSSLECQQYITALENGIFVLQANFGKVKEKVHCVPIHEYEELINLMDEEENFPLILYNDKETILELIKAKIAEACAPGNVQIVAGGTGKDHEKSASFVENTHIRN